MNYPRLKNGRQLVTEFKKGLRVESIKTGEKGYLDAESANPGLVWVCIGDEEKDWLASISNDIDGFELYHETNEYELVKFPKSGMTVHPTSRFYTSQKEKPKSGVLYVKPSGHFMVIWDNGFTHNYGKDTDKVCYKVSEEKKPVKNLTYWKERLEGKRILINCEESDFDGKVKKVDSVELFTPMGKISMHLDCGSASWYTEDEFTILDDEPTIKAGDWVRVLPGKGSYIVNTNLPYKVEKTYSRDSRHKNLYFYQGEKNGARLSRIHLSINDYKVIPQAEAMKMVEEHYIGKRVKILNASPELKHRGEDWCVKWIYVFGYEEKSDSYSCQLSLHPGSGEGQSITSYLTTNDFEIVESKVLAPKTVEEYESIGVGSWWGVVKKGMLGQFIDKQENDFIPTYQFTLRDPSLEKTINVNNPINHDLFRHRRPRIGSASSRGEAISIGRNLPSVE